MRVIIVPSDGMVSIDGKEYTDIDLAFIPNNVHAVQWYDTFGEVEICDQYGRILENQPITSLDDYQLALDRWEQRRIEMLNNFPAAAIL